MNVETAISHAIDGNAVLFLGAGFSWGATNLQKQSLPQGRSLAGDLLREAGYPPSDVALDKAAAAFLRRKSKQDLVNYLVPRYTAVSTTSAHQAIAGLPWRRVYTTNYDTVFEEARKAIGGVFSSIEATDHPRDFAANPSLVVHINGLISRLAPPRLDDSFKLTSASYATEAFERSNWAFQFRNDIRVAAAVIFVGYSMYDLDIRRAVFHEDISDKCVFITAPMTPDNALEAEDLSDLGVVAPVGVAEFGNQVTHVKASHIPQEQEILLKEWRGVDAIDGAGPRPSDGDVLEFLVTGTATESLVLEAMGPHRSDYLIERTLFDLLTSSALSPNARVLLTGELGSGKSFLTTCIDQVAIAAGWAVFRLEGNSREEIAEAESIVALDGPKLLVIENYQRHMDLLRWISESALPNVSVLITARVQVHELFEQEVIGLFGDTLRMFDLSRFDRAEIGSAVEMFNRYGLWGERSHWAVDRKRQFISHDCNGQLASLLVDVLKSKHVTERYSQILEASSNRGDVESIMICAFSLEAMGFQARVSYIQELLANKVNWVTLRSNADLRSIIDLGGHMVCAKSPVLAMHLLHEVFAAKTIVSTLLVMAVEADDRRSSNQYFQILNSMMRYRNLSVILPDANRREATINFYEGAKNLSATRRNPQFWLQYAIACLAFDRLDRAEIYFKDAYSYASPGYNTYQIDNHYARFLLEKAMLARSVDDALPQVDQAKKIILQQMATEVRSYPYRVAVGLFRFYERFNSQLTPIQRQYFERVFREIEQRGNALKGRLQNDRYVADCLSRAAAILTQKP